MKKIKAIIICLLSLLLITVCIPICDAVDLYVDITSVIPNDALEYAKTRLNALCSTAVNDQENFDIDVPRDSNFEIGTPYVIYSVENNGNQDEIYYMPVIQDDAVCMILNVMPCNDSYTVSLEKGMSEQLNSIGYKNDDTYIFYFKNDSLYAENENSVHLIDSSIPYFESSENGQTNSMEFERLSYSQKITKIKNSYSKNNKPNLINYDSDVKNLGRGFSSNKGGIVTLNTKGCTVPQGNYGLCWAASVATTVRYLNYSKYSSLTAKQVANKMGIGYNDGATDLEIKEALKKYGQTYKCKTGQLTFLELQNNIVKEYPLIMTCISGTDGHAVTCVGYTTYGGIKQVTFWNSGNKQMTTVEYQTGGTKFAYAGKSFVWKNSVYHI